jgi:hypothetical protein
MWTVRTVIMGRTWQSVAPVMCELLADPNLSRDPVLSLAIMVTDTRHTEIRSAPAYSL